MNKQELVDNTTITVGYYRCINSNGDIPVGELVYVTSQVSVGSDGSVHFICLGRSCYYAIEKFIKNYVAEPNGEAIRAEQIQSIKDDINDLAKQEVDLNQKAIDFKPHVTDDGSFTTSSSHALAMTPSTTEEAKVAIATFRNEVGRLKKAVLSKSAVLKALVKEQQEIIQSQLSALTAGIKERVEELSHMVGRAEEAIWTINLYLGKDEEIVQIASGTRAPADTKITIRQLVLYMDEECMVAADSGGIDAMSVGEFDKWLISNPDHLRQVFPEPKGIVAIKPRRITLRDYGDPIVNVQMRKANNTTYFLIRNGDNLYRVYVDFNIGKVLVPSRSEFVDVFYHNVDGRNEPLEPGSDRYMEAMERAEEGRRHYLRAALIVQGLIDRTKILQPLPVPRINFLSQEDHDRYVDIIYDAQTDQMLPDGRLQYQDWLEEANSGLCVGQRIMGFFNYTYSRYDDKDSRKSRIYPNSADLPDSDQVYTIESKGSEPGSFYFYYKRSDYIYRQYGQSGLAKVRARCTVYRDDCNLLNFDAPNVTVEAMEYYLSARTHRHNYMAMVPLLKRAISLKRSEARQEEPFRKLLVSQIMNHYGVSAEAASEAVPDLVSWWKFKNQTHRALLSNDKSALKMIVAEFDVRRKRKLERLNVDLDTGGDDLVKKLVNTIMSDYPGVVLIAHKRGNEYIALIAHNDENVFVREQLWATNRSSSCPDDKRIRLKHDREWRTADARWHRWHTLYQSPRWANWIRDSRSRGYLTDPEREAAVEFALSRLCPEYGKATPNGGHDGGRYDGPLPFAAALVRKDDQDVIKFYYCDSQVSLPGKYRITERSSEPTLAVSVVAWERDHTGSITFSLPHGRYDHHFCAPLSDPPWRAGYSGTYYSAHGTVAVLREWPDNVAEIQRQQQLHKLYSAHSSALSNIADRSARDVEAELDKRQLDKLYAEYLSEYGDPELWEDHKSGLKIKYRRYKYLRKRFSLLTERYVNYDGWTLGKVFGETGQLISEYIKDAEKDWRWSREEGIIDLLDEDMNIIVKQRKLPDSNLPGIDDLEVNDPEVPNDDDNTEEDEDE